MHTARLPWLALACITLAPTAGQAQAPDGWSHAVPVEHGTGRVDVAWSAGPRRTARVTAVGPDGATLVLHDGATVRTAVDVAAGRLCVVAYHGGDDHPFADAHLAHLEGRAWVEDVVVHLPIEAGTADRRPRFPASALVAATPHGFAVMLQHQERDTSADVVTTLTVLGADGAEVEATHVVPVPWALADLVWSGDGYHLAVIWGGWSGTTDGRVRINLVRLDASGSPTEHPWWASPAVLLTEVELAYVGGAVTVGWRDGRRVVGGRWTASGGWSAEPPAPDELGAIPSDAVAWTLAVRADRLEVVAPR